MVVIKFYRHFYSNPFMDGKTSATGLGEKILLSHKFCCIYTIKVLVL